LIVREIFVDDLPRPRAPLCHAVEANGFVFVSGQVPLDPSTGNFPDGIEAQARQCLRNVATVLEGAGTSIENVVKVHVFLSDLAHFAAFNEVYREVFGDRLPARTAVGVSLNGFLVEVDCTAVAGLSRRLDSTVTPAL
jgi:2-iminobutanoate/2-iminopropanoate deaminase